ncbi:MAG: sel1 repeat family protein [Gammaproteobacteria bacterium]|nr:sel1 repeat family protein [Gammaproteobacteria bacterium]
MVPNKLLLSVSPKLISSNFGYRERCPYVWISALAILGVGLIACDSHRDGLTLFQAGEFAAAHRPLELAAMAGDLNAQNLLGIQYYLGLGVPRNLQVAREWFQKAARRQHPSAQKNLGLLYLRGFGVTQDYHQAYGWLHAAFAQGETSAADYLNLMTDNLTPSQMHQAQLRINAEIARESSH